jgi:hypothetical protein
MSRALAAGAVLGLALSGSATGAPAQGFKIQDRMK